MVCVILTLQLFLLLCIATANADILDDFGLVKKPSRATYGARFMATKGGSGSRRIITNPKRTNSDYDYDPYHHGFRPPNQLYEFL